MEFTVAVKTAEYKNLKLATTYSNNNPNNIHPDSDNGVFVSRNGMDAEYSPPGRGRDTTANGCSRGILNMLGKDTNLSNACSIALQMSGRMIRTGLLIYAPNNTSAGFNSNFYYGPFKEIGDAYVGRNSVTTVHKVEVMTTGKYTVPTGGSEKYEHIYAMGFTTIMYGNSGEILGYASWMFAPMVDANDGDGYPKINVSGYPFITNSSVMFDDTGACSVKYNTASVTPIIPGTNVTGVTGNIATAMSDSVLESNTGILAVACMVSGDGYARWVGYKNGVYKVYQGSKPLYGMPGERMTIKGHEFVCLAYGPFYARLS